MKYTKKEILAAFKDYMKNVGIEEGGYAIPENTGSAGIIAAVYKDLVGGENISSSTKERIETKTFQNQAAQGDMLIRKIDKLPDNVKPIADEGGNFVLAHSETGHNHVVKVQPGVEFYQNDNDPFIAYLIIEPKKIEGDVQVKHLRDHDTHEPLSFFIGDVFKTAKDKAKKVFEIRRQREYTPEGFRRAQD